MQPCLQVFTTSIFCFLYFMVSSMQMWKGNISSCAIMFGQEKVHTWLTLQQTTVGGHYKKKPRGLAFARHQSLCVYLLSTFCLPSVYLTSQHVMRSPVISVFVYWKQSNDGKKRHLGGVAGTWMFMHEGWKLWRQTWLLAERRDPLIVHVERLTVYLSCIVTLQCLSYLCKDHAWQARQCVQGQLKSAEGQT